MEQRINSKKVRFADSLNRTLVFRSLPELSQKNEKAVDPRRKCRQDAKQQKPKGFGVLLKGSFEDPIEECQRNLNAFVQLGEQDLCRGIERYLSPQHKEERDSNKNQVVRAVLEQQDVNRRSGIIGDTAAEKLRCVSQRYSDTAKVFARRFGIADEHVVKVGEDPSAARSQINSMRAANAKKAFRQPSSKLLKTSIRDMACLINARKACRQASSRELNTSIQELANDRSLDENISPSVVKSSEPLVGSSKRTTLVRCSPINSGREGSRDYERYLQTAIDLLDEDDPQLDQQSSLHRTYGIPRSRLCLTRG